MGKRSNSRSDVQQRIESIIFEALKEKFVGTNLVSNPRLQLSTENNISICPDFYSKENKIIGEIHVHTGKLKAAQVDKVAADVLKMHLYDEMNGRDYEKYIIVCDNDEYNQLKGNSFLAEAIRQFGIRVEFVEISEADYLSLKTSMRKQNLLVNGEEADAS